MPATLPFSLRSRPLLLLVVLLTGAGVMLWRSWPEQSLPQAAEPGSANRGQRPVRAAATAPGPPRTAAFSRGEPGSSRPAAAQSATDGREDSTAPSAAAPVPRRRFAPAPAAARLPLVFALPPEEMSGLNERQAAAAAAIADQFYTAVGGEAADPSAPDYKDRWKREQPLADYQLRAAIGAQAYARWQEEAYLRAKADSAR